MFKSAVYTVLSVAILAFIVFFVRNYLELKNEDESVSLNSNNSVQSTISKDQGLIEESQLNEILEDKSTLVGEGGLQPEVMQGIRDILNTSSDGLVEVKTDKGEMVDLKDRFRTAPVATINKKGEVVIQDYVSPPNN